MNNKKCLRCGNNLKKQQTKYCSKTCRLKPPAFCKNCGHKVKRINGQDRAFCELCKQDWAGRGDKVLRDVIYDIHHKSSAFSLVRSRARAIVKDEPQVCEKCGYDKHVEVCHIKAISTYEMNTLLSVINDRKNLVLLCPNCHWEFDNL